MKRWLKRIAIVVVVLIGGFIVVGLFLPTSYEVSRSIEVEAPEARVHELVADLRQWPRWEPWRAQDPTIQTTLGEATTGVGASQSWTDSHGGGELTFTESDPDRGVRFDLLFSKQYACVGWLHHEPAGEGKVTVTWGMAGDCGMPIVGGYMALLMPGMVGPMFDNGLANIKREAEASSH